MKTIILAGGFGTRLSEETTNKPKPMVEIGGKPMLWHIMKHYAFHGFSEFLIALGYKAEVIKRYFIDQGNLTGNLTVEIKNGRSRVLQREQDEWTIHLENTGLATHTGGRIKKLESWLRHETFMVTYGDGVSDVPIDQLLKFHKSHGRLATVTAVRPPARFGGLIIDKNSHVTDFTEKPQVGEGWINGGFLVFEPAIFDMIQDNMSSLESDVLENLAKIGQLSAYCHDGFWQCMDTVRDLKYLEDLWSTGRAPWKLWI